MAPPLAWISLSSHGLHLRTTGFAEGNGELESSRKKKGVSVGYINRRNLGRTCPIRRLLENPGRTVFHLPSTRTASEIPSTPSVGRAATRQPPPTGQPADIVGATTPPCWPQPGTPTPWVNVPLRTRAGARSPACWFAAQRRRDRRDRAWPRASMVAAAATTRLPSELRPKKARCTPIGHADAAASCRARRRSTARHYERAQVSPAMKRTSTRHVYGIRRRDQLMRDTESDTKTASLPVKQK